MAKNAMVIYNGTRKIEIQDKEVMEVDLYRNMDGNAVHVATVIMTSHNIVFFQMTSEGLGKGRFEFSDGMGVYNEINPVSRRKRLEELPGVLIQTSQELNEYVNDVPLDILNFEFDSPDNVTGALVYAPDNDLDTAEVWMTDDPHWYGANAQYTRVK